MSRLGKMTENMYGNQDRDGLRMEKLSARSAEENMAEWDRLSKMKRGLHRCERNRLARLLIVGVALAILSTAVGIQP